MKTHKLKVTIASAVLLVLSAMATTTIAASYFDLMAIGVSYTAVAILIALAVVDYRGNVKNYASR